MNAPAPTIATALTLARSGDIEAAIEIANRLGGNDSATIQAEVAKVVKAGVQPRQTEPD